MNNAFFAGNLTGGGLQVATSYINDLLEDPKYSRSIFKALIIHKNIFNNLSEEKKEKAKEYFNLTLLDIKNNLLNIKLQVFLNKFKIVFCLFGPLYIIPFLKNYILVSGFARPDIIFKDIYQYKGLRENLKSFLCEISFKLNTNYYIVESHLVKERLRKYLNVKCDKIYVVNNAISNEIKRKKINKRFIAINKKEILSIGFLGNHYKHKRIDILIEALNQISKNCNFDIVFLVTLKENDFMNFLDKNKCNFRIKNLGYLNHHNIHNFYDSVDICVSCSELECFSAFPLESMFFFKPIICSDYPFHSEIYKDYPFYFKGGNCLSLFEKIMEVKHMNSKKLESKLSYAYEYVVSLPSSKQRTNEYNNIVSHLSKH